MWGGLVSIDEALAEKRTVFQLLQGWWAAVVDVITPPKCLCCVEPVLGGAALCVSCWQKLVFIDDPVCALLGTPFEYDQGDGALSPAAIAEPPPWEGSRAAVAFNDTSAHLIHLLKYRDTHEAGIAMARMMALAGRAQLSEADLLIPVPLHRFRLWQRRFNQSAILCQHLSRQSGKPVSSDVLVRTKRTRQQVGLTADERRRNVRKAFSIGLEEQRSVEGKVILLVDDVRTTGATAAACAEVLKAAGAAKVLLLTFALVLEPFRLHIDE
jgi:ComF family protein